MDPSLPFRELVARIRAGDQDAAAELVRHYEPEIRRSIRVRLTDPNLRRAVDSADICQSVLGTFFVRVAAGQFDLTEPVQLVKLLVRMARNKIIDHASKPANRNTLTAAPGVLEHVPGLGDTPSGVASEADLLAEAKRRMSAEELAVGEERAAGRSWEDIAAGRGTTPDAARKRHERTLNRVCGELGLG